MAFCDEIPKILREESLVSEVSRPTRDLGTRVNGRLLEMKGEMFKLTRGACTSDGRCFVSKWNRRYFALFEGCSQLFYWKSEKEFNSGKKPKGELDLTGRHIERHTKTILGKDRIIGLFHFSEGDRFLAPEKKQVIKATPDSKRKNSVSSPEKDSYFDEWMAALTTQVQRLKGGVGVDDFDICALLGSGSFGKVFLVRQKESKKMYAMKVLRKAQIVETMGVESALAERQVLVTVSHPFIVCLHYCFQNHTRLFFVMDFVQGGELFSELQRCKKFVEERAKAIGAQVASALAYLHRIGILYRDLKPENILITNTGHIKIADFGLSKQVDHLEEVLSKKCYTIVGSPYYTSPEIIVRSGHTATCDWWSLGVLLFEMQLGYPPFYNSNQSYAIREIVTKDVPIPSSLSEGARSIIEQLLQRVPEKRLGHEGSHQVLQHPWWADLPWDNLTAVEFPPEWRPELSGPEDLRYFSAAQVAMKTSPKIDSIKPEQQRAFSNFDFTSAASAPATARHSVTAASPPWSPTIHHSSHHHTHFLRKSFA